MNYKDAMTAHHDTLDISNPEWRKAREELWRQEVSGRIKDGATYKLVRLCQEIFMGDREWLPAGVDMYKQLDEDDDKCYSAEGMYWQLHPLQNEAKWRHVIVDFPPMDAQESAAAEEGIATLIGCRLARHPSISYSRMSYFGWSSPASERFTRYCLGGVYQPDGYVFEGYQVKPPISPSIMFGNWLYEQRAFSSLESDGWRYTSAFSDYAFSLLDYVHPAILSGKDSRFQKTAMEVTAAVRYMLALADILGDYLKTKDNPFGDSEARYEYFLSLVGRILSLPEEHPLRILWGKSKGKPHISSPWREKSGEGPLLPEEDIEPMPKGSKPIWFPDVYIPPYLKP